MTNILYKFRRNLWGNTFSLQFLEKPSMIFFVNIVGFQTMDQWVPCIKRTSFRWFYTRTSIWNARWRKKKYRRFTIIRNRPRFCIQALGGVSNRSARRCCLEGRPWHTIFRPKTAKRIQSCTDDQMAREICAVTRSQTSQKTVAMHLWQTWPEDILCIFHLLEFVVVNFFNGGANILIRLKNWVKILFIDESWLSVPLTLTSTYITGRG